MPASPRSSSSSESLTSPIHGFDSSAALILVPDDDPASSNSFDFTTDEDTDDDDSHAQPPSVPPLSSITVFVYLLAPLLKLGALLVPRVDFPFKVAIPALLFFAGLSALTRQIWYMLARYVRRADMEEIVLETFARERAKEGRRWLLRQLVRINSGVFRVLLSVMYLRASVDILLPLLPQRILLPSHITTTLVLGVIVLPLYLAPTLAADRVIYATWISVASYFAWLICTAYAHAHGLLVPSATANSLSAFWQGIPTIAFAFTTVSTVPLYAALRGTTQPMPNTRPKRLQSFKLLSLLSVAIAVLCILPLVFFKVSDAPALHEASPLTGGALPILTAAFYAASLTLFIPSILVPTPGLPIPFSVRRIVLLPLSKVLVYCITIGLSLAPSSVTAVLSDIVWVLAFLSTYMLPAFIHIILHNFRRPLSIIIPPNTPVAPSASSTHSDSRNDELLQRKERTLQRRRLGRRLVWDIGVWVLLVPVGGGGLVWAAGRVVGGW
ncbi:hypothetical protein WOLCODRAFT_23714 [Wolfiporia cocos MD-104 SS10]|uniref:Amino acid transporter transmembrane domain-containing protein n=1 Tax=Wolfiporia cocos (strain MD-104) TaxID=742152 RepID=A0A2H3JQ99_WOLCO|nr:hypothetical protein WOLCODRAFT_23714 [Wolfiporia cocos MD-104 SS10]